MKTKNWLLVLIAILVIITLIAPAEKTLGNLAKLVYLHAALSLAITVLLIFTGAVALISLFNKKSYSLAKISLKVSLVFQIVNIVLVPIITGLTWGVFFAWQEPRVILTVLLLGLTLAAYLIEDVITFTAFGSLLLAIPGLVRLFTLGNIGRLMHPINPIGSSDSLPIKIASLGMFLTSLAIGFLWISYLRKQEIEQGTRIS